MLPCSQSVQSPSMRAATLAAARIVSMPEPSGEGTTPTTQPAGQNQTQNETSNTHRWGHVHVSRGPGDQEARAMAVKR